MKILIVLSFVICGFFSISAQERYVKPVDESKKDASFLAFRTNLIKAVEKRDSKFIIEMLDPNIKLSFGGSEGIRDFKKIWKPESANSKFWSEFSAVIKNGGLFINDGNAKIFTAPYSFNAFPDDLDVFEYSVIFGNNVNLRSQPNLQSSVITQLSYNIVKVDFENSVKQKGKENDYEWLKIETLGGKKGFVKAEYVRSPIDYRAGFEKKKDKWKMTFFIAGD